MSRIQALDWNADAVGWFLQDKQSRSEVEHARTAPHNLKPYANAHAPSNPYSCQYPCLQLIIAAEDLIAATEAATTAETSTKTDITRITTRRTTTTTTTIVLLTTTTTGAATTTTTTDTTTATITDYFGYDCDCDADADTEEEAAKKTGRNDVSRQVVIFSGFTMTATLGECTSLLCRALHGPRRSFPTVRL